MDKRVALVTGSSRDIGRAGTIAQAAGDCHALINHRNRHPDVEEVLTMIRRAGGSGELSPLNVAAAAAFLRPAAVSYITGGVCT